MATKIKQGDAYALPIQIRLNDELIDIADVETAEFYIGEDIRKLYPGDVTYEAADNTFYLPLTQADTFSFPANGSVTLDIRVKFTGGDVIGVLRPDALAVYDAVSEVVL